MTSFPNMPRAFGLMPTTSAVKGGPAGLSQVQSPLIDLLPTFREPLAASFVEIDVPGIDCSGSAAWYSLIDVDVDSAFGQDVLLFSADIDQLSPDVLGDAANDYLPWGQNDPASAGYGTGSGAVIVIGTNLPTTGKAGWTAAPINIAGMNQTGTPTVQVNDRAQYILSRAFPVGAYGTATQVRRTITKSWAPFGYRFPRGSRIQAALVVQGSQIVVPGLTKHIRGGASVQLWCGMTQNPTTFGSLAA